MNHMQQLGNNSIKKRPSYPIRVMQFGGGNFLRAFTDWLIEELNERAGFGGNIAIVKPTAKGDYNALRQQDGLFHVILNGLKDGQLISQKRLIQCVSKIIHSYQEWPAYLQLAENPQLRFVVSNTTESGIRFNPKDRMEDQPPEEFPAKLTLWLYHRFQLFNGDLSKICVFLPLELVEQNGDLLKQCILQYADLWKLGTDFKQWVEAQSFCNTLVDRIVSGYPKNEAEQISKELGVEDQLLVAGEYYHSWIIQGPKHVQEELPFAKTDLNVQFADDLEIYRKIKVRILNGAHTSMVPVAYLSGARTVLEAMQNDQVRSFIEQELYHEILPTLRFPEAELKSFVRDVLDRFSNPTLQHKLADIALNSTSKYVTRLLPSLLDYYDQFGKLPPRITFSLAALIRFYSGAWQGNSIPLRDSVERLDFFKKVWQEYGADLDNLVYQVLKNTDIWGMDLNRIEGLKQQLVTYLNQIKPPLRISKKLF